MSEYYPLSDVSQRLHKVREIVFVAVKNSSRNYEFTDPMWRDDRDLARLKQNLQSTLQIQNKVYLESHYSSDNITTQINTLHKIMDKICLERELNFKN